MKIDDIFLFITVVISVVLFFAMLLLPFDNPPRRPLCVATGSAGMSGLYLLLIERSYPFRVQFFGGLVVFVKWYELAVHVAPAVAFNLPIVSAFAVYVPGHLHIIGAAYAN